MSFFDGATGRAKVVDFGQRRGRWLLEQHVEPGFDAIARDRVARAGRGGDGDCGFGLGFRIWEPI